MTNRKNLKIDEETYRKLRERKDQYETWDGFFNRLINERPDE